MDFRTGKVRWTESRTFGKGALLAVGGQLVVLGEDGRQLALVDPSEEGLKVRSSFRLSRGPDERWWSAPALAQGRLYVRNEEKIVCLDLHKP